MLICKTQVTGGHLVQGPVSSYGTSAETVGYSVTNTSGYHGL